MNHRRPASAASHGDTALPGIKEVPLGCAAKQEGKRAWPLFLLFLLRVWPIFLFVIASLFIATDTQAALTINSVTYTYGTQSNVATVYVPPSATISVTVNETTTANTSWGSTAWQIATAAGTLTCDLAPTPDLTGNGAHSTTFSATAPATAGTYNGYFQASNNASSCAGTVSALFTSASSVIVDATAPTIPTATIASNNASPAWAKTGDIVTLTFTVNDNSGLAGTGTPVVTISGVAATVAGTYPNFTATRTMLVTDTEGVVPFTINVSDKAGNAAAQRTAVTSGSNVTFDRTLPTIPTATIASNNATPTLAYTGDTVTLTFTVSDTSGQVQTPVVNIGAGAANVAGTYPNFTATRIMTTADVQGTVTFTINVSDMPGNAATPRTAITSGSNVTFMKPPTATTNAASGITSAVATLNGTVSSNGTATTSISFEYGLTNAYGDSITATPGSLLANDANIPVSASLVGLNCNTPFHYRVVATNTGGTAYGLDGTFTTGVCSAPFSATACAATRFNGDLSCTFSDVRVTNIALVPGSLLPGGVASCVSGTTVTMGLDLTVNFSTSARYDVGLFIANDGKLPTFLPANGGAGSCSVDVLPITAPPFGYTFPDLDGVPQGTLDTCGDGSSTINVGTGSGIKRMSGVTLSCKTSPLSGGNLFAPFVVSWDNQKSPLGNLCTSNLYPVPNTAARCSAAPDTMALNVVVLPVITKTDGITTINPGASTTYTVVISNNSGGPLQAATFTDLAVANLTVNSVSCATSGPTCPTTTVPLMQGAGIAIPSLPNGSSLTFTINATLSGAATPGSHIINTATVTIGVYTNSASDDDLIVVTPSATKSFAPSTITEGAASVLTITLTNPTVTAVTGVSFTDTYPSGLANTASPSGATTCGGTVTAPAGPGSSVALSGGTIPANGSCTVTVNVTSALAGSYNNTTGPIAASSGTIPAASATLTVNIAVFGAFNACDVGTCVDPSTTANTLIKTKIAGASFSLDIVALKASPVGSWNTSYNKTVTVELLDASNGGVLDTNNCNNTWTVIATLSPNPAFAPGNGGLISVGPFTVANAYRDVRVRVTESATKKGCSTDNFAIRPNVFTLIAQDTDAQTPGTVRTLNNVVVTSGFVHKAGQPFTFTATAYNAAGSPAVTSNYVNNVGHPTMTLSACAGTACTGSFGTFAPGVTSFTSGTLFSNGATYSEVGSFNLTLQDTNFASVDAGDGTPADCSATGRYICSVDTPVGRFVPDHFAITSASATAACSTGTPFTYFGQDGFTTTFTLTAQNAGNNTTTNYAGVWAKLVLTNWPSYGFTTTALPAGSALAASATAPAGAWINGSAAAVVAKHQITRPTNPAAPTTATVSALPVDQDGVTMSAAASLGSSEQRFGILKLDNVYGSELLNIRVPVRAMYLQTAPAQFVVNMADNCTTISTANVAIGNYKSPLTTLTNCGFAPAAAPYTGTCKGTYPASATLSGGGATLVLNSIGVTGSADIALNLGATSGDANCIGAGMTQALSGANLSWLRGNWCGIAGFVKDPSARLTFGTAKSPFIYLREKY